MPGRIDPAYRKSGDVFGRTSAAPPEEDGDVDDAPPDSKPLDPFDRLGGGGRFLFVKRADDDGSNASSFGPPLLLVVVVGGGDDGGRWTRCDDDR